MKTTPDTQKRLTVILNHIIPHKSYDISNKPRSSLSKLSREDSHGVLPLTSSLHKTTGIYSIQSVTSSLNDLIRTHRRLYQTISAQIRRRWMHLLFTVTNRKHRLNLIELLIAITIIVTFSGVVGAVYVQKLEETRINKTKLDIHQMDNSLVYYYSRHSRYPTRVDELVKEGDLQMIPRDPWDTEYIYIPQLDWTLIGRAAQNPVRKEDLTYHTECVKVAVKNLSGLPESLDPMLLVAAASEKAYVFSRGLKEPILGENVVNVTMEKQRQVAQEMKRCQEKAAGVPELHEAITSLIQLINERTRS